MRNPYSVLGVSKQASAAEIKKAYRALAKKLHPDLNPSDKVLAQKFTEATNAYDLLSDKEKRARYDRGEIDENGQEKGFSGFGGSNPFGGGFGGGQTRQSGFGGKPFGRNPHDMEDILSEFFGGGRKKASGFGGFAQEQPPKGSDITYALTVDFEDACLGEKRRLTLANKKTIDINIPAGTEDGRKLRLKGQGSMAAGGAGDAIIEIHVRPHAFFKREKNNILLDVPISLNEAVLGAQIEVPTLHGKVSLKIPKGANTGMALRLKGKGIKTPKGEQGDMRITLKLMMPDTISSDFEKMIEKWAKKDAYNPRAKLDW